MSVKQFFNYPTIRNKVIEFLKSKGDYEYLHSKHKRPFRGYITLVDGGHYVCDNFNMMKCTFTRKCKENFERVYPSCISVNGINNMLVCLQEYKLKLRSGDEKQYNPSQKEATRVQFLQFGSELEVILEIDLIDIVSFDIFSFKNSPFIQYDGGVRIHTNFVAHYFSKKQILQDPLSSQLTPITRRLFNSVEKKLKLTLQIWQQLKQEQSKMRQFNPQEHPNINNKQQQVTNLEVDQRQELFEESAKLYNVTVDIVQLKGKQSSAITPSYLKKLGKLKENNLLDGFLSCDDEEDQTIRGGIQDESTEIETCNQNVFQKPIGKGIMTQKREEELDNIDNQMENFLDIDEVQENDADIFILEESKTHQEVIKLFQKIQMSQVQREQIVCPIDKSKLDAIDVTNTQLEDIMPLSQASKGRTSEVNEDDQFQNKNYDLRKKDDILSNSDSILENERLQRELEQQLQKDRVEILILSPQQKMKSPQPATSDITLNQNSKQGNLIGKGLHDDKYRNELIQSKQAVLKAAGQHQKKQIVCTQDDLLDVLDDCSNSQKNMSVFKTRETGVKPPATPPQKIQETPKREIQTKQQTLLQFAKKRYEKHNDKINSQSNKNNKQNEIKQKNVETKKHQKKKEVLIKQSQDAELSQRSMRSQISKSLTRKEISKNISSQRSPAQNSQRIKKENEAINSQNTNKNIDSC